MLFVYVASITNSRKFFESCHILLIHIKKNFTHISFNFYYIFFKFSDFLRLCKYFRIFAVF